MYALRPPEKILALNRWLQEYSETNGYLSRDYHHALLDKED
jgi:hypothetical protein